jgi:short-subunit dehydrogenase
MREFATAGGLVEHMDESAELDQIKTNYLGPLELIRKVLPVMRERRSGCIINISSASGFMSMPTMASYGASKSALEAASEALWYETRAFGVRIHSVEPGFIRSKSFANVKKSKKAELSESLHGPQHQYYTRLAPFIEKLMGLARANPETIASRIMWVIRTPLAPLRVPITLDAAVLSLLRKLLPDFLFTRFMLLFLPPIKS